jgi:hypothetical protein
MTHKNISQLRKVVEKPAETFQTAVYELFASRLKA